MNIQASPVTDDQKQKILKALYYSAGSGFVGGFTLAITGALTGLANGGDFKLSGAIVTAVVVGGVVGALNSLAVTVKQIFTPGQ